MRNNDELLNAFTSRALWWLVPPLLERVNRHEGLAGVMVSVEGCVSGGRQAILSCVANN